MPLAICESCLDRLFCYTCPVLTTLYRHGLNLNHRLSGPSQRGWALLLIVLAVAALLRLWALDVAPPGLYRDEASNGLDALGVLQGNHAVYFTANNGREPAYIYLTALAISLLGRTVIAVRLAAALVGALTTVPVYLLGRAWFGQRVALFAAWLWAVTLWPVHLSRLGLRAILLPPLLALVFWLGTLAFRRQQPALWLAAGIVYGAAFYTYLAVRFTPVLLFLLLSYLLLKHRPLASRLWPGALWFALGTALALLPLAFAAWQNPSLVLGRVGQVSILNPDIGGQNPLVTLLQQAARALGMFLWRGDDILRHNPAGRPVFDLLMAIPFLMGLVVCLRGWGRKSYATLLLWSVVMLGPTILAEDAPHFLRAAGVLPAALFLPALGLSKLWEWPKLADALRRGLVLLLVLGTLIVTTSDYVDYVRQPDTAYLFESAARELAQRVNAEPAASTIFVDRRYREGWPSIPFLLSDGVTPNWFAAGDDLALPAMAQPVAIYAWPYEDLAFVARALQPPVLVAIEQGALARGDLEAEPYPLYVRYGARAYVAPGPEVIFDERVALHDAMASVFDGERLRVELYWSALSEMTAAPLTVFVHVVARDAAAGASPIAQIDVPLAQGYWPVTAWQPGQVVRQQHEIDLSEPFDHSRHQIVVGLYDALSTVRLPASTPQGEPLGNFWLLLPEPHAHEEN